ISSKYANKWEINPDYIKKNFPRDAYTENSDGTINLRLTIFFRPQSIFIIGLFSGGAVIAIGIGILFFLRLKKRRETQ
ncbi:MAG: hypothetical protein WCO23_04010, partial [bacterium]